MGVAKAEKTVYVSSLLKTVYFSVLMFKNDVKEAQDGHEAAMQVINFVYFNISADHPCWMTLCTYSLLDGVLVPSSTTTYTMTM